jgi:hypothetical protein
MHAEPEKIVEPHDGAKCDDVRPVGGQAIANVGSVPPCKTAIQAWAYAPNGQAHLRPMTTVTRSTTRYTPKLKMNFRHVHRRQVQPSMTARGHSSPDELQGVPQQRHVGPTPLIHNRTRGVSETKPLGIDE